MRRAAAASGCIVALTLSACGSTHVAAHPRVGDGLLTFVRSAPSTALGVENTDLYSVTPDGAIRNLTSTPAAESDAVWSADGKHVVFTRRASTIGERSSDVTFAGGIYVWSPGNGAPHRIAPCSSTGHASTTISHGRPTAAGWHSSRPCRPARPGPGGATTAPSK